MNKLKVSLLFTLGVILLSFKANAQSKFYVATEANFIYDLYQVTDEGNAIGPSNIRTVDFPGTTLIAGYKLNPIFSLETGVSIRPVKSGFSLTKNETRSKSESGGAYYHIPIRTRARVPIFGDWLYATASLGVNLSVTDPTRLHLKEESGSGRGSGSVNGNEIYSYNVDYISYNKYFINATADAGFDFQINPRFNIYSTFSYNRGFTDLERTNIRYQFQNQPERNASVLHQGSYLSVNIGLRFNF